MPLYLSLFSFLTSLISLVYGILGRDPYIMVSVKILCYHVLLFYLAELYFHTDLYAPPEDTKRRRVFNRNSSVGCVLHLQQVQGVTKNTHWNRAGK